jgi:hypothetical protein
MRRSVRFLLQASLLSAALIAFNVSGQGALQPRDPGAPGLTSPSDMTSATLPEVRLRKLHLVRPDLISYPIAYEVIC